MIPFASLADKRMAEKIAQEGRSQNIYIEIKNVNNEYILEVDKEENIEIATDIYRVMMGLPKQFTPSKEWSEIAAVPMGFATKAIIVFCIAVYALDALKIMPELYSVMKFSSDPKLGLNEIVQGQFWRAITPIFLHFGLMHILFNMLWMKDLGKLVEVERSSNFLLLFILVVGSISNFSQYLISGPNFGGMSGVVYGLLGYLWMYKRFNKESKYSLPKSDVILMVGWFFLCLMGVFVFSIANMAHALGLSLGMFAGIFYGQYDTGRADMKNSFIFTSLAILFSGLTLGVELFKLSQIQ